MKPALETLMKEALEAQIEAARAQTAAAKVANIPPQSQTAAKSETHPAAMLIAMGIVALVVGCTALQMKKDEARTPQEKLSETCGPQGKFSAMSDFENAVKQKLKAPSTASFGNLQYKQMPFCTWEATGYVDAQNSFGAMMRSNFKVDLHYDLEGDRVIYRADVEID